MFWKTSTALNCTNTKVIALSQGSQVLKTGKSDISITPPPQNEIFGYQSRAIPGCFIVIGCWIKSHPDTTDTVFFLIGYCVAHFIFLIGW